MMINIIYFLTYLQENKENKDGFKDAVKAKLPELSDEEKEDIVSTIIMHFENPEPVSPPPKGGRKYGGRFRRRSSSYKDNRKSISENDAGSLSPNSTDHANGHNLEVEKPQNEIIKSQENGENN